MVGSRLRLREAVLPEGGSVIELRRRLYPERHDYVILGMSVTDPRPWEAIPIFRALNRIEWLTRSMQHLRYAF